MYITCLSSMLRLGRVFHGAPCGHETKCSYTQSHRASFPGVCMVAPQGQCIHGNPTHSQVIAILLIQALTVKAQEADKETTAIILEHTTESAGMHPASSAAMTKDLLRAA